MNENYAQRVLPRLDEIRQWRRSGYGVKQVAKMLGIGYSTMRSYAIEYPELEEALKKGQEDLVIELENALFRKALGYNYTEEQEYQEIRDGRVVTSRKNITRKTAHPDTGALAFALKNLSSKSWKDHAAQKSELDAKEQNARIERTKAETERIKEEMAIKSGVRGIKQASEQVKAIADMINNPEGNRTLNDFLSDDFEDDVEGIENA